MTIAQKRVYARSSPAASRAEQMLNAPPFGILIRMASPNAVAFLVQAAVSMAEVMFVSQLGTVSLAALALLFPGLMLMQMLANGAIGGAVSSAVARAMGAGNRARAEALIWHALAIAAGAGLFFLLGWQLTGRQLLAALGAEEPIRLAADGYAGIVFGGAFVVWVTAMLSSVYRGLGNMKLPAALMIVGAGVQVPLAGTLILGWFGVPALGLQGAAVALITVALVNACILLARLHGSTAGPGLRLKQFRLSRNEFREIFRVGALASLSPIFTVLSISLINGIVSGFGVAALAGYGIVARLEFLLVPMVFGLGAAMTALVGTNMGAGNVARAEHIGWVGGTAAAALTGCVGVVLAISPGLWLGLFTADPHIWAAGESYLRIVGPAFAFQGLGLALYFASQGAGTVVWPVAATVLRFAVGVGGATLAVTGFHTGLEMVYVFLALGMLLYGSITAIALKLGAWQRQGSW